MGDVAYTHTHYKCLCILRCRYEPRRMDLFWTIRQIGRSPPPFVLVEPFNYPVAVLAGWFTWQTQSWPCLAA